MPKLPDETALLGNRDYSSPRPVNSYKGGIAEQGAYDAAVMTAQGGEKLAAKAGSIAEEQFQNDQRIQYATAVQGFIQKKGEIDAKAETDTDYTTLPDRYQSSLREAAATAGEGIGGGAARAQFEASMGLHIASGVSTIQHKAVTMARDADRGWLTDFIDQGVKNALSNSDEGSRTLAFQSVNEAISGMAAKDSISEREAAKLRKSVPEMYANKRAVMLTDSVPQQAVDQLRPNGLTEKGEPLFDKTNDWRDFLSPDKRMEYLRVAESRVKQNELAAEVDAQRRTRLDDERTRKASIAAEGNVITDIFGPNAQGVTAAQIADPNGKYKDLLPAARLQMIGVVNRQDKPDPAPKISHDLAMDLVDGIRAGKITDTAPLFEAYNRRDEAGNPIGLTNSDFGFVQNVFKDMQTDGGDKLGQKTKQFFDAVKPTINKSNPLMGTIDMDGPLLYYQLEQDVATKVAEYRKANKDPHDLFNPSKPDYLGKPEALAPYQKSIPESIAAFSARIQAGAKPAQGEPRKAGESAADYLKRTGK